MKDELISPSQPVSAIGAFSEVKKALPISGSTGQNTKSGRSIGSVLIFTGSVLCFFLPFATVSCGGMKALTLTGQELATGTTVTQPAMFGRAQTQRTSPDPFAAAALFCAVAGVALSLIGRRLAGVTALSAGGGAICLLVMKSRMEDEILKQGMGMVQVTYEVGFALALCLFVAGVAWNLYLFARRRKDAGGANAPPSSSA